VGALDVSGHSNPVRYARDNESPGKYIKTRSVDTHFIAKKNISDKIIQQSDVL